VRRSRDRAPPVRDGLAIAHRVGWIHVGPAKAIRLRQPACCRPACLRVARWRYRHVAIADAPSHGGAVPLRGGDPEPSARTNPPCNGSTGGEPVGRSDHRPAGDGRADRRANGRARVPPARPPDPTARMVEVPSDDTVNYLLWGALGLIILFVIAAGLFGRSPRR